MKIRPLLATAALLVLPAALPASAATTAPAGATYSAAASAQLLADVNAYRHKKGLHALKTDSRLQSAARTWALRMATSRTLAHDEPLFSRASHTRLQMRLLAENVGFDLSVGAQHRAFLASPHHRANLEIASLRAAGVAVVVDAAGYVWSVEDFGSPRT